MTTGALSDDADGAASGARQVSAAGAGAAATAAAGASTPEPATASGDLVTDLPAAAARPGAGVDADPDTEVEADVPVAAPAQPGSDRSPAVQDEPAVARPRRPTSRRARARRRGRVAPHVGAARAAALRPGAIGAEPVALSGDVVARPRRTQARVTSRRRWVLAAIGVLTLTGAGLAVWGLSAVRSSTVGRYETAAGPSEPGYRASVVPTPTMGVLLRAEDGSLAGAAVLALAPGDAGGSVVLVPSATVVSDSTDDEPGGEVTLGGVYASDGPAAASQALGRVVTAAISETVEVDSAQWSGLVDPVGDVEVSLDGAVADFPAGDTSVAPADVGRFLAVRNEGEDDLRRVDRQQQFWNSWLPMVRDAGEAALPGEVDSGIGRFVRVIAAGDGTAATLPLAREETPDGVVYRTDDGRLGGFVAQTIPFPTSPEPGRRIRVRLLNGSGDESLTTEAARALVAAGAEIDVIGNPDPLDQPETLLIHQGGPQTDRALWLRTIVGGGRLEVVAPDRSDDGGPDDEIDVTVILGQDAGALFGREQTSD